ncbi:MAG TPA: hypothetical protein VII58_04310 [Acidobacteriaceae bacterium]
MPDEEVFAGKIHQHPSEHVAAAPEPSGGRRSIRKWVLWMIGIAAALGIVFLIVFAWVAHNAEPILKQRVIANLEQRFQTHVELAELHISVFKGLQVTGAGLRIDQPAEDASQASNAKANVPPLIYVRSFSFRTGVRQLMEPAMRVDVVRVDGLRIRVPPKHRETEDASGVESAQPGKKKHNLFARMHIPSAKPNSASSRWKIVVDKIVCADVILTIETDKPGKQPLVFPIRNVTLHDVGRGTAMPFEANLINAKPVGEIASTGHIGPWRVDDPRETHVDGDYSFTNADLGPIKGVAGILSSTGSYSGALARIDVTGATDTPDFSLDSAEHKMPLHTDYNATVDGTNGDTVLNSVHATLGHTVLDVHGSIIRAPAGVNASAPQPSDAQLTLDQAARIQDAAGHIIRISVQSDHARIEDLLKLGVRTMPPLMDGAMTLRAHLTIPPGHVSVAQKMQVGGAFTIRNSNFSNPQWQDTVDKLSARASGDAEKAKRGDVERVSTQMGGDFLLANAVLDISRLHFQMPGAAIDVAGMYSLSGDTFNFAGTARTSATASQMLTGWKSLLTKPFDKLLEKDGSGVEVPITISGTRSEPKFGVDTGKLKEQILSHFKKGRGKDKAPENQQPEQNQPPAAPPSRNR